MKDAFLSLSALKDAFIAFPRVSGNRCSSAAAHARCAEPSVITTAGCAILCTVADSTVAIETIEITESGNRQIASRTKASELLAERRSDIEAAVTQAADLVRDSLGKISEKGDWKVSRLEANFGIKLKAEAGVILTRVGAEASFDVRIVVERA